MQLSDNIYAIYKPVYKAEWIIYIDKEYVLHLFYMVFWCHAIKNSLSVSNQLINLSD